LAETAAEDRMEVVGALAIPGLRFRRYRGPEDLQAIAEVANAGERGGYGDEILTQEGLANRYAHLTDFIPDRDLLIAEVDGRMVAHSHFVRTIRDGELVFESSGSVHPRWQRRGLGRAMLRYNEKNSRAKLAMERSAPTTFLGSWSPESAPGNIALLKDEHYRVVRRFLEMERPNLEDLPDHPLPAGLEIRRATLETAPAVLLADSEAFQDHWGARPMNEETIHRIVGDPDTDIALWQVAWAGEQVIGSVLPMIHTHENTALGVARGKLERISVRRNWRRQGVARALITAALHELSLRGMKQALLGVDADSTTGAVRLYEDLGFHSVRRAMEYRKPI
jgi:mycothiol synthase